MLGAGTTLNDRYMLADRLGGGGMGEVWRADDLVLGRAVAVKVMTPALSEHPTFTQRFQNEARAMATLRHRGVVGVYDYGVSEADGRQVSYLVMEYVRGESLDRVLRRGPLGPQAAMRLVAEVADALGAAHAQGIVHRDVKPANLMVRDDGSVALTDFGIARSGAAVHLTATGTMLGSAAYCAPEMAAGSDVTPAVDIYALGVVAYECVTGRLPYQGDTPVQIIFKHLNAPVPELPGDVPASVRHVVRRALEKAPERRWPSASEMARAARGIVTPPPSPAEMTTAPFAMAGQSRPAPPSATVPPPETAPPSATAPSYAPAPRRRRALVAVLAMTAAVLVSVTVAVSVWLRAADPATGGVVDPAVSESASVPAQSSPARTPKQQQPPTKPVPSTRPSGGAGATKPPRPTPTASVTATPTPTKPTPTTATSEPEPSQEPSSPGPEEPTSEPTGSKPTEDIQ